MLEKDVEDLVRKVQSFNTELNYVEVKEAHIDCPKKLYDTISAFSNLNGGGILLFGLREAESFAVVGVYDAADLQKKVTEQCKQMQPVVRALFTCCKIEGKMVVSAEIPEIDIADKPCFYKGKGRLTGSYIRVGDSDEQMTEYEIYSYDAFRKKYQDDIRVLDQLDFARLDKNKLDQYMIALRNRKERLAALPKEEVCELMSITKNRVPTLTGLLLFGKYPQGYFPQLRITAIVVPGTEVGETGSIGERFIDNRRIDGTLPEMLDEAVRFVHKNMSTKTIIDKATGVRRDRTEYPMEAVREVVLNALIHRDYSIHTEGMPIQIQIFKDRLEVKNPGGIYGRFKIDHVGKVQPDTRNPVLATMMEDLGLTENRYSGIPTIYRAMKEWGLREPVFADERGCFSVILYNEVHAALETKTGKPSEEHSLLQFCQKPRSRAELAEFVGVKTAYHVMQRYILPLIADGKLEMTLPDKPKSRYQKFVARR